LPERTKKKVRENAGKRALICARAADEKKARDVIVLDLRGLSYITDFFIVATAANSRQLRAICDEIAREMDVLGDRPVGQEGTDQSGWLLVDYGDLVVHVFDVERRKYYDLDLLWGDTPRLEWRDPSAEGSVKLESEARTR